MPTAIAFMISQVHDRTDRHRVAGRCRELTARYSTELGGYSAMSDEERTNVAIAAELVSLVELGRDRVRNSLEPGDPSALKRLEVFANQVLAKLQLEDLSEAAGG
jgi:hypothetical protein